MLFFLINDENIETYNEDDKKKGQRKFPKGDLSTIFKHKNNTCVFPNSHLYLFCGRSFGKWLQGS